MLKPRAVVVVADTNSVNYAKGRYEQQLSTNYIRNAARSEILIYVRCLTTSTIPEHHKPRGCTAIAILLDDEVVLLGKL